MKVLMFHISYTLWQPYIFSALWNYL